MGFFPVSCSVNYNDYNYVFILFCTVHEGRGPEVMEETGVWLPVIPVPEVLALVSLHGAMGISPAAGWGAWGCLVGEEPMVSGQSSDGKGRLKDVHQCEASLLCWISHEE